VRLESFDDDSVFVNEEFGEIPENCAAVLSEELPQRMSSTSIHTDFGEEVKGHAVSRPNVIRNLRVSAWLLVFELIAREGQDPKTRITVGIIAVQSF